jgi:hypothetical protein
VRDSCIQTGVDVGLYYNWPAGSLHTAAETQYGLAFVDPASVAVSVVSADALEGKRSDSETGEVRHLPVAMQSVFVRKTHKLCKLVLRGKNTYILLLVSNRVHLSLCFLAASVICDRLRQ